MTMRAGYRYIYPYSYVREEAFIHSSHSAGVSWRALEQHPLRKELPRCCSTLYDEVTNDWPSSKDYEWKVL